MSLLTYYYFSEIKMKRTLEYEEEDQDPQEVLDLMKQVSEAKKSNILLKDQLQKNLLAILVRDLDSPTDVDLPPQSQEILEIFKLQTARSMLLMHETLYELSLETPQSTLTPEEMQALEDNYGDDEASDDEVVYKKASDDETSDIEPDGDLTRSSSLVEMPLDVLQPTEPQIVDIQITGDNSSSYSRDCCTLETTHCAML